MRFFLCHPVAGSPNQERGVRTSVGSHSRPLGRPVDAYRCPTASFADRLREATIIQGFLSLQGKFRRRTSIVVSPEEEEDPKSINKLLENILKAIKAIKGPC